MEVSGVRMGRITGLMSARYIMKCYRIIFELKEYLFETLTFGHFKAR